ncbi:CHASE domain-containing protein [Fimbriimonas ginsengisoli]|uniref:histidine kinase n=1 Tax=Fimbriimonas ginsengisoli Gsoil 348 TaxID=661478 RepID=A0A068NN91_FIMGI|nr:CHASE domain-containing protein [Fimbriimonas ginsengisoli]AIE84215.1 GAF sensor signal transduction histidine kinase [Fimbriimonas ginsengisoli Gsoil 348]
MEERPESLERKRARDWAVPYVVFGLGLLVTLLIWQGAHNVAEASDKLRFQNSVQRARNSIRNQIEHEVAFLRTTAAMFSTQGNIDRKRFHDYYQTIGEEGLLQGIPALGFSYRIPAGERDRVIARMRAEGQAGFKIFPPGGEEHAILYLEPEDERNRRAIGMNMHQYSAERREAMDKARDTGKEAMTSVVRLIQDTGLAPQPGFNVYFPVYRHGNPNTVELRRQQLSGFIYSPFRAKDLFDSVHKAEEDLDIGFAIYDDAKETPDHLLYSDLLSRATTPTQFDTQEMAGHQWGIRYAALPAFQEGSNQGIVNWIPIVGLCISSLLATLSMAQARTNREMAKAAETIHRREFQQRLLAHAGALLTESLDVDRTLAGVANLAVPSFADWCSVDMLEPDGSIRRVAVAHTDPAKLQWAAELQKKYPPDPNGLTGVPNVLRTGKAELYSHVPAAMLENAMRDEETREIVRRLQLSSFIVVPMKARDRTLGAISFVWAESGNHYDRDDLMLAEEIGVRAGLAVDNAQLFENLEELVRERTTELEASNKELEAFCYSVSHDLRAPLRSVDGFSKAVIDDYGHNLDREAIGYLERVRAAARRMDELITALLNLSRLTRAEIHRQVVDASEIAASAAADVLGQDPGKFQVRIQPGIELNGDPRMVHIIFDNLIANAMKFSSRAEHPLIEIGMKDGAVFVRDNGVGFNPEYGNKLFSPFERLHSPTEFPGSGIGLATVQRIVARHGGKVWAEGEEGKGATFWFTLGG